MFGLKMVRFGSPDLRTGALGVKQVRGTVSPYSRAEIQPKKAHFGPNRETIFIPPPEAGGPLLLAGRHTILESPDSLSAVAASPLRAVVDRI